MSDLDNLIEGVCKLYNCCQNRAVDIIAKRVNAGEKEQLEKEITQYISEVTKVD